MLEKKLKKLDNHKLRANAAKYVNQFLHCIEKLITGTLEGNPIINGQSLEEEKSQDETGDWINFEYNPIKFDPSEWKIPHYNSKLYGGQQFERLLAEFKIVAEHIQMKEISSDEIANAAGPQKLTNASNCLWVASDIVNQRLKKELIPLIDQFFIRAIYIMKRLINIAENMMYNIKKNKRKNEDEFLDEIEHYSFFVHAIRDLYSKFIDETAKNCKKKCKEEFFFNKINLLGINKFGWKTIYFSKR